jgi:SP family sugar:H+ symporter-like MFS transporter
MNAIIGYISPTMFAEFAYGAFFFYGGCCFVMGLIVFVFLPETKGRSLEEINEVSEKSYFHDQNKLS